MKGDLAQSDLGYLILQVYQTKVAVTGGDVAVDWSVVLGDIIVAVAPRDSSLRIDVISVPLARCWCFYAASALNDGVDLDVGRYRSHELVMAMIELEAPARAFFMGADPADFEARGVCLLDQYPVLNWVEHNAETLASLPVVGEHSYE